MVNFCIPTPKVWCRSNKSSTSSCAGMSEPSSSGRQLGQWGNKDGSSPPKPFPRSSVPPVARPRSSAPPKQLHLQNSPLHSHAIPQHNGNHHLVEDNDSTTYLPHSTRYVTGRMIGIWEYHKTCFDIISKINVPSVLMFQK